MKRIIIKFGRCTERVKYMQQLFFSFCNKEINFLRKSLYLSKSSFGSNIFYGSNDNRKKTVFFALSELHWPITGMQKSGNIHHSNRKQKLLTLLSLINRQQKL